MIPLLLEHGADVNARDRSGATPLTCALDHHRPANANLLRKHGGTT